MALLPKRCAIPNSRLPARCYDQQGHPNEWSRLPEPCSTCPDCPDAPQSIILTIADLALCDPCQRCNAGDRATATLLSGALNGTWELTPHATTPCLWTTAEPVATIRVRYWWNPTCTGAPSTDRTVAMYPRLAWLPLYPKWSFLVESEQAGVEWIFRSEAWAGCHQGVTFMNDFFCGSYDPNANCVGGGGTALIVIP